MELVNAWEDLHGLRHVQEEADWATAKRVLGQPKFIERLMTYDADNILDSVLEALQRVVTDARFTADQVCLTRIMPGSDSWHPANNLRRKFWPTTHFCAKTLA